MLLTIIIFFIAISTTFTMLAFRAWQIRTSRVSSPISDADELPDLEFRHIEKNMLYLTKHIVQIIILDIAKSWFTITTKTRKWVLKKWPRFYAYFERKPIEEASFVRRAIHESKIKIKRVRDRVKEEHGHENDNVSQEEVKKI